MCVFSIIIPVYNASGTIHRCLDSIFQQSFADFEVICVNDGSTDSSWDLLLDYSARDARLKCIDQLNFGPSVSRNRGLQNAIGNYVMFVDADDYFVSTDGLASIYNAIISNAGCELVYFAGKTVLPSGEWSDTLEPAVYEYGFQCMKRHCALKKCIVFGSVFVQCYKKSLIDTHHIRFDESLLYGEDRLFVCTCFLNAGKTVVIPDVIYVYVVNENSLMHDEKKLMRLKSDNCKMVKQLERQVLQKGYKSYSLRKYMHGLYVQSVCGLKRKEIDWKFLFRNASTLRLMIKDLLLFLGVNKYAR